MSWSVERRSRELLRFIAGFQQASGGVSPSLNECAGAQGLHPSEVHRLMMQLRALGHISTRPRQARAIQVHTRLTIPTAPDGAPLYAVPIAAWPVAE